MSEISKRHTARDLLAEWANSDAKATWPIEASAARYVLEELAEAEGVIAFLRESQAAHPPSPQARQPGPLLRALAGDEAAGIANSWIETPMGRFQLQPGATIIVRYDGKETVVTEGDEGGEPVVMDG